MTTRARKVLYVDDDAGNRLVFEQTFSEKFDVKLAACGADALELLRTETIAVLLVDQRMPGMSGNELLESAKRDYPDVVRMVVTAYSDLAPILQAVNEGLVARYVVKPWNRSELEKMIAWGLEAHQIGEEHAETQVRILGLERLATLGSLQAAMMHDLMQPLTYIRSNLTILVGMASSSAALTELVKISGNALGERDRGNIKWLAEELPGMVDDMLRGCNIMTDLVDGVRRLLKSKEDKNQTRMSAESGVQFAISVCRRLIMAAGAIAVFDEPKGLAALGLDSAALAQVLINLLSNAAQAIQSDKSRPGRVELRIKKSESSVEFSVVDNGPGMPPETLKLAGTPFFSTRPQGTGLGVYQCRRLVEGAGGTFRIESKVGLGTTVTFSVNAVAK